LAVSFYLPPFINFSVEYSTQLLTSRLQSAIAPIVLGAAPTQQIKHNNDYRNNQQKVDQAAPDIPDEA
jgi:hypothetical protein